MKFYLSWNSAPPDPPYWKWLPIDGILVSITNLKKSKLLKRALLIGLPELLGFHGEIFLDSGTYEEVMYGQGLRPRSPNELLTFAEWLHVNLVAHLDTPFIGKYSKLSEDEKWLLLRKNIINAEITHKLLKQGGFKVQVVYVIQGWNKESLTYCAEKLARLNASYYALGSLVKLRPSEIISRVRIVREIIGEKPKLHLFGVSKPEVVKQIKSLVDSIDSSTASIAGAMKELIHSSGRRHIDRVKNSLRCNCPVCHQYRGAVLLIGKKGSQKYYNQLRKIHNTYQLLKELRKALA